MNALKELEDELARVIADHLKEEAALTRDIEEAKEREDIYFVERITNTRKIRRLDYKAAEDALRTQIILEKLRNYDAAFPSKTLQPQYWNEYKDANFLSEAGMLAATEILYKRKEAAWNKRTTTLSLSIALASFLIAPFLEKLVDLLLR